VGARKNNLVAVEWEVRAKNLLKSELKRRGVGYAQLAERLSRMGIRETERNIANKVSRGGFTAAFLLQCLAAVGAKDLHLEWGSVFDETHARPSGRGIDEIEAD
jgi:hypothetical protein